MNQPALRLGAPDILGSLLQKELGVDSLAQSLGFPAARVSRRIWERALGQPLARFFAAPGKQIRARLVHLAFGLAGGAAGSLPVEAPYLVEMLHAGSLIVDDVEDGSLERRGQAALHTEVGVPLAINAGNWLYFWPMAILPRLALEGDAELALFRAMSGAVFRCHYGQALDLSTDVRSLAQDEIPAVVEATTELKTGSLFELSAVVGAILAGAERGTVERLGAVGRDVGVGLQMLDDVSGLFAPHRRGKGHEDLTSGRPTWPWAWLANRLDGDAFGHIQQMAWQLQEGPAHAELLAEAIRGALGSRELGLVDDHLRRTTARLLADFGGSPAAKALASEIERMAGAYA